MKHDQKCRALKMVSASLNTALASNKPDASGKVTLTEAQVNSALVCVKSVLADNEASDSAMSPVDIAQLILEVLTLILSNLPGGTTPSPTPAPTPAIDVTGVLTIAETIMEILEAVLSKQPQSGGTVAPATTDAPAADLSAVDIAGLILSVLQLLLSKFGTPTPAPAPTSTPAA